MSKRFDLGDVLSVTTGMLLSPKGMDGIYEILNYMTRDSLYTHQLPRAYRECAPHVLRQHPELANNRLRDAVRELRLLLATTEDKDKGSRVAAWVGTLKEFYGNTLPIEPIPQDDHDKIDPMEELEAMVGDNKKIIVVRPDGGLRGD